MQKYIVARSIPKVHQTRADVKGVRPCCGEGYGKVSAVVTDRRQQDGGKAAAAPPSMAARYVHEPRKAKSPTQRENVSYL